MSTPKWPGDHEEKHRQAALKGWEGRRSPMSRRRQIRDAHSQERQTPAPESQPPKYTRKQQELYDRAIHYSRRAEAARRGEDNPYGNFSSKIFGDEAADAQRKLYRLNKQAHDDLVNELLRS